MVQHLEYCLECSEKITLRQRPDRSSKFCTHLCACKYNNRLREKKVTVPCTLCNKDIIKCPSLVKETNFCNLACKNKYRERQITVTCSGCLVDYQIKQSAKKVKNYCAQRCIILEVNKKWEELNVDHSNSIKNETDALIVVLRRTGMSTLRIAEETDLTPQRVKSILSRNGLYHKLGRDNTYTWKKIPITYTCEICGWDRVESIERCHIIPAAKKGPSTKDNMLVLCSNHHIGFDRKKLLKEELMLIQPKIDFAYTKYNYVSEVK